jgi:hypothetical protein
MLQRSSPRELPSFGAADKSRQIIGEIRAKSTAQFLVNDPLNDPLDYLLEILYCRETFSILDDL